MRWRRATVAGVVLICCGGLLAAPRVRSLRAAHAEVAIQALPVATAAPAPEMPARPAEATTAAPEPPKRGGRLSLAPVDREPKDDAKKPSAAEIAALRKAVADAPRDRVKRFDLVRALMLSGDRAAALAEVKAWREKDAYNLVVVRLLGDLHAEMGEREKARRAYSAVVELLPGDPEAQRALATVLKQGGDLEGAYDRLRAASAARPDDVRTAFELADAAQRLGRVEEAAERFRKIIDDAKTPESVRYPAKQRLTQIDASLRRAAASRGDREAEKRLTQEIDRLAVKGGVENDIKIYLTWDTDRTDVDLWVRTPSGEVVDYRHRTGSGGEALFDDVTSGYGPESFTAKRARPGKYEIQVNYFGTRRQSFSEARGEVVVILGEGTAAEEKHVLPYRLFRPKQTVTVAAVDVKN